MYVSLIQPALVCKSLVCKVCASDNGFLPTACRSSLEYTA